jgi:hypothetical protein
MNGKQFQRIGNAGGAGIGESRGFHSGEPSPALLFCFRGIRSCDFSKVKLLGFAVFSTFGLALNGVPTHPPAN